jgi:N-acetylneuraminate synthase/N,N'-diacetyllegionaminate synthase
MKPALCFHHADADRPARVCVIAELGVNHDGDVKRALELTDAAADADADAIKLQRFDPDHLLSNQAGLAAYQDEAGEGARGGVRAMLKRLMLDDEGFTAVRARAKQHGLAFIVTPFSLPDVAALARFEPDAVKIASPDAVNTPLLEAAARLQLPMLISTGTCDLDELDAAAQAVRRSNGALLQCVSAYPTDEASAALGGIAALRQRFGVPVGYSDHTPSTHTGAWAVAAGACVLEKHLTHDRDATGPDHAASLDPGDLAAYVVQARAAAAALGPIRKACLDREREVRQLSRQSVCVVRDLPAGHVVRMEDVTIKRPGTGIPARQLQQVVGRTLKNAVRGNDLLREEDLA